METGNNLLLGERNRLQNDLLLLEKERNKSTIDLEQLKTLSK